MKAREIRNEMLFKIKEKMLELGSCILELEGQIMKLENEMKIQNGKTKN